MQNLTAQVVELQSSVFEGTEQIALYAFHLSSSDPPL
jgi:hypothetical protein